VLFLAFVRYKRIITTRHSIARLRLCRGTDILNFTTKHWFIVFHILILGICSFFGLDWLPTDVYFETCITKPCQVWRICLLDAHQWLQRLTFSGYCDEQLYSVQLLLSCSGVARAKIWGCKMFDFRRITLFCLEKRLLKHKMTIFSKHLEGGTAPLPSLATPVPSCTIISTNALFNKSVNHNHIWTCHLPLH